MRIVWHFQAQSEPRSFRIHYRLRGVAVAYDDVVDVNVQVWGDEWETGLGQLTAAIIAPADIMRAWGHPVGVRGDVTLDGRRATLRAIDIPAGQFVELRALVPRRVFTSTDGMKVVTGPRARADRRRGARRRGGLRARPAQDRRRAPQPAADARDPARARARPGARADRVRLVALRPRARDGVRPRVRAGAADRDPARARAVAARPGRDAGIARVHRDAVRPDPPRPLPLRAGDDRAEDLGRPQDPAGRGSRALARRRGGARRGVRGAGRPGGRRDPRRRARSGSRSSATGSRRTGRGTRSASRRSSRRSGPRSRAASGSATPGSSRCSRAQACSPSRAG